MNRDEAFMKKALEQAEIAYSINETPIGAVIVREDEIVGVGFNRRETGKNALYHAELIAINDACKKLGGWRLWQCEMYVTLEPCPMCAGAIINSRLRRVVFGAYDNKGGACGSITNLLEMNFNHKPEFVGGVMEDECSELMRKFFRELREKKQKIRNEESSL